MSKKIWLSGKGYPTPHTKKIFFADLHDLGHEMKEIKKVWRWPNFVPKQECCYISKHNFFGDTLYIIEELSVLQLLSVKHLFLLCQPKQILNKNI